MSILSENLKSLRNEKKYNQGDIAKLLNISQPGYARYENGLSEPDIKSLKLLSQLYQVSVDTLIGNQELANTLETKEHWFSTLKPMQQTLISLVLNLNELQQHKLIAFIQGMTN